MKPTLPSGYKISCCSRLTSVANVRTVFTDWPVAVAVVTDWPNVVADAWAVFTDWPVVVAFVTD